MIYLKLLEIVSEYTDMAMSTVVQRQSVHYGGSLSTLQCLISQLSGPLDKIDDNKFRVFQTIEITIDNKIAILEVS